MLSVFSLTLSKSAVAFKIHKARQSSYFPPMIFNYPGNAFRVIAVKLRAHIVLIVVCNRLHSYTLSRKLFYFTINYSVVLKSYQLLRLNMKCISLNMHNSAFLRSEPYVYCISPINYVFKRIKLLYVCLLFCASVSPTLNFFACY